MTRLILEFQLEKPEIPLEYDRLMVSFLKAALEGYSPQMYEKLYDKTKSIIKGFSFALFLPGAKFEGDTIHLQGNRFTMFFSDADMGETILWFNAFQLMKFQKYPMNQNSMTLISIRTQSRKEISESEIVVRMQSSLLVRRHNDADNTDRYFTYEDAEFSEALRDNIRIFLERMQIPVSTEGFSIFPVKAKKIVATCFGRKVDGNIGIYKLCGSPELLNLLYQAGMGVRRSEGHGLWEIIG